MDEIKGAYSKKRVREVYACKLWEYMIAEDDDILKMCITNTSIIGDTVNITLTGNNYDYFENCLNIINYLNPNVLNPQLALERIANYAVKNRKVDYWSLITREDVVKECELIEKI